MYVIKSEHGGKVYYVGNIGGAMLQYGLVNPDDKRVLRFGNPSVCELTIGSLRQQFRGQRFDIAYEDEPIPAASMPKYVVRDSRLRDREPLFASNNRPALYQWIIHGLRGTQGAERDHYVSLLLQLEDGKTELDYNEDA